MNTSSATTPAGSVEFFDGAVDLGAGSAPSGTGASVTSTFTTTALPAGVDAITAKYTPTPGATYVASQGSLNQTVNVLVVSDLVVSDFAGQGVWGYSPSGGWQQLMSANASLLAVNANGDVAAEFPGYGVYHYTEATEAWLRADDLQRHAAGDRLQRQRLRRLGGGWPGRSRDLRIQQPHELSRS